MHVRLGIAVTIAIAACGPETRPPPTKIERAEASPASEPVAAATPVEHPAESPAPAATPAPAPADQPPVEEPVEEPPPVEKSASRPVCPKTFAKAQALSVSCPTSGADDWACSYKAGSCGCAWPPQGCSGKAPPRPTRADFRWRCTEKPPRVRADGCPGAEPKAGDRCTKPQQSCMYTESHPCGTRYQCNDGKWAAFPVPPPP